MAIKLLLKRTLALHEMTQKALALQTGIRPPTISAICQNSAKHIPIDVLDKICNALNCQPSDIIKHIPEADETTPAATSTELEDQTEIIPELQESPIASQHPTPQKRKPYYKPFTKMDESKIDLIKLLANVKYQLEIGGIYGMEVLTSLMEKARQQDGNILSTSSK